MVPPTRTKQVLLFGEYSTPDRYLTKAWISKVAEKHEIPVRIIETNSSGIDSAFKEWKDHEDWSPDIFVASTLSTYVPLPDNPLPEDWSVVSKARAIDPHIPIITFGEWPRTRRHAIQNGATYAFESDALHGWEYIILAFRHIIAPSGDFVSDSERVVFKHEEPYRTLARHLKTWKVGFQGDCYGAHRDNFVAVAKTLCLDVKCYDVSQDPGDLDAIDLLIGNAEKPYSSMDTVTKMRALGIQTHAHITYSTLPPGQSGLAGVSIGDIMSLKKDVIAGMMNRYLNIPRTRLEPDRALA